MNKLRNRTFLDCVISHLEIPTDNYYDTYALFFEDDLIALPAIIYHPSCKEYFKECRERHLSFIPRFTEVQTPLKVLKKELPPLPETFEEKVIGFLVKVLRK